jgi:anti-sigma B factor antagonist
MMSGMSSAEFEPLSIKVEQVAAGSLVSAFGEIDTVTAPELQVSVDEVMPKRGQVLAVDLTGVTFLSSAGLSVLVQAHQRAEETGGEVRIVTNSTTARVFQLTGLDETLRLFSSVEEARA